MAKLGEVMSEETKRKISDANKGRKHSIETRKKISEKLLKNPVRYWLGKRRPQLHTQEYRDRVSQMKKGKIPYIMTDEVRNKISKTLMGHTSCRKGKKGVYSEATRVKMSLAKIGRKLSKETREKMSLRQKERVLLGIHHLWRGGISYEPYSVDWSNTLKQSIRERDKYRCQLCGNPQGDRALDVHHIDYNKKNCDPENLISLCHSCHSKTNGNRDYWLEFFKR